jgi:hypothetical protein
LLCDSQGQSKIKREIAIEFHKKTAPQNNPAIYNYNHPTDIYLMALRASDKPEVALTKVELENQLNTAYGAGVDY